MLYDQSVNLSTLIQVMPAKATAFLALQITPFSRSAASSANSGGAANTLQSSVITQAHTGTKVHGDSGDQKQADWPKQQMPTVGVSVLARNLLSHGAFS